MATYVHTAIEVRNICDQYGAIMIVNDSVGVAKVVMADGVHLGLNDMNPKEAREILGNNFIIGDTANTAKDCMQHIKDGVDYIGLGPFRHTTTKKNLSPTLGLEGCRNIISAVRIQNSKIPIVGIGGVTNDDVSDIVEAGVSGIAVSGMLTDQLALEEKVENVKLLMTNQPEANS